MKSFIWMSFDLGVRGDFEGMYGFLDAHNAKECGDSVGVFWYEYKKDLIGDLKKDLQASMSLDRRSRVYVVYQSSKGKHIGKFIIGKRKAPPWAGFGPSEGEEEDIGE